MPSCLCSHRQLGRSHDTSGSLPH